MKRKIGWQKYEEAISDQLDSSIMKRIVSQAPIDDGPEFEDMEDAVEIHADKVITIPMPVPIPPDVANEVSVTTNFDCWIGHTNFELMESMRDTLNRIDGVELLQIRHRYRFFIGLGKMFKFSDVRRAIEQALAE